MSNSRIPQTDSIQENTEAGAKEDQQPMVEDLASADASGGSLEQEEEKEGEEDEFLVEWEEEKEGLGATVLLVVAMTLAVAAVGAAVAVTDAGTVIGSCTGKVASVCDSVIIGVILL